jgi:hypothetical protein
VLHAGFRASIGTRFGASFFTGFRASRCASAGRFASFGAGLFTGFRASSGRAATSVAGIGFPEHEIMFDHLVFPLVNFSFLPFRLFDSATRWRLLTSGCFGVTR